MNLWLNVKLTPEQLIHIYGEMTEDDQDEVRGGIKDLWDLSTEELVVDLADAAKRSPSSRKEVDDHLAFFGFKLVRSV